MEQNMKKPEINGPILPSSSGSNDRTVRSPAPASLQPNFSSRAVQEALEHLATIDLSDLFNEAKIEYCRATRDLRRCGRYVQYALNSCGHASLCAECCQRCDFCPICRIPLTTGNNRLRQRLYDECVDAGLISRGCHDRFQDKEDRDSRPTADVQRLYSFFDVALENNLVSLVCHYVTDICMDETAVSSDAITALLLDEKVVKDWVKLTFKRITTELQGIYYLEVEEMKNSLGLLLKFSVHLATLSSILEVLESSFKGRLSAQLHDLHHLQESILKTKQHLEITIWCIRHQFLEHVKSRHANFTSWHNHVRERKSAATVRAWPDLVDHSANSTEQHGSLFIEDALANLDIEQAYDQEITEESYFAFLLKNGALYFFRSKIEGMTKCYPFESLQAAVDILFLCGSSDLVVAKQAIFLYYLFDRHWSRPEEEWRHIVDDFAASFGISRHSLLESFTFCLLDDHTDEALQECYQLLPEISGPATHPKIAKVLLERQNPEAAHMVLRWSGRDGGSQLVSLSEAVTVVWVKVECGLLTEAFTYQRMLCTKVREKNFNYGPSEDGQCRSWMDWTEVLVSEFCCLCIRRNLVDRIIELPWNSDEEKYVHKCLLDCATIDPSTANGSLLVVFYLQRYRYVEAYQVNLKLWSLEQDFISTHSDNEEFLEVLSRMESHRQRRKELVVKGIELLPEVLEQQVKTGTLPDIVVASGQENEMPARSGLHELQEPKLATSIVLRPDNMTTPLRPDLYKCSSQDTTIIPIDSGETNLLRIINAALNQPLFFTVANHKLTVVGADASYTKPFTTSVLMLGPGQTTDVLIRGDQPPARYYIAARAYQSAQNAPFDNTTTTAILEYPAKKGNAPKAIMPSLPAYNDTNTVTAFSRSFRSLRNVEVPTDIDENLFFTVGLGLNNCPPTFPKSRCQGPNGTRFTASMNNVSFVLPQNFSLLQAHRQGIPGVFTTDFPGTPPVKFDYTGNVSRSLFQPIPGTKLYKLKYGSRVQVVIQDTSIVTPENHPIHLHGYDFYIIAEGFGNFDPKKDTSKFNLVDPPLRNTVAVPVNGWAVIRFVADNPGVWIMHCHLDVHITWGLAMAFLVENGVGELQTLQAPPLDLPIC